MKFVALLLLLSLAALVCASPLQPPMPPGPDDMPIPEPPVRVVRQVPGMDQAGAGAGMAGGVPGFNEAKGVADMAVDMVPDVPGMEQAKGMYAAATGMMG